MPNAGFLSPASRGALLTALLVMYLLLAVAAGYAAVFIWGMINRSYEGWYNVCWRVSCYFPGITLGEGHASMSKDVSTHHECAWKPVMVSTISSYHSLHTCTHR